MEIERIVKCLQDMRNNIIKTKKDSTRCAKELLHWLSGTENWTDEQCRRFYESILRQYIIDDAEALSQMLAVSGLSDGYRNPNWSAAERRKKYLSNLSEDLGNATPDDSTIRKREDTQIWTIAELLKSDYDQGKISRALLAQWTTTVEGSGNTEPHSKSPSTPDIEGDTRDKKFRTISGKKGTTEILHKHNVIKIENIILNFRPYTSVILVILISISLYFGYNWINHAEPVDEPKSQPTMSPVAPPIEHILIPDVEENIIITPGEVHDIKYAVIPVDADISGLSFVSLAPDILTVSPSGKLTAYAGQPGEEKRSTEVIIQSENGKTKHIPVTVKFSDGIDYDPIPDLNNFEAGFVVEQEVRLEGDTDWKKEIDAKVGDKVEYLITYKNTSNEDQKNVMIQDVLPKNMRYVPNSTILYNGFHENGALMTDDEITTTGVNIGNYGKGVTVYVKFTAEVVDNTLQYGSNILGNWAQCSVGLVALQDYTLVYINKDR